MNGIMNEAQSPINGLWYCDAFEKEMNFSIRWRHTISNTQKHKKNGIVLKEYEIIKPETCEIDKKLDKDFKDSRDKFRQIFENRCV